MPTPTQALQGQLLVTEARIAALKRELSEAEHQARGLRVQLLGHPPTRHITVLPRLEATE